MVSAGWRSPSSIDPIASDTYSAANRPAGAKLPRGKPDEDTADRPALRRFNLRRKPAPWSLAHGVTQSERVFQDNPRNPHRWGI